MDTLRSTDSQPLDPIPHEDAVEMRIVQDREYEPSVLRFFAFNTVVDVTASGISTTASSRAGRTLKRRFLTSTGICSSSAMTTAVGRKPGLQTHKLPLT